MSEYGDKHRSKEKKAKVARYTRDHDGALDASGYETPGKPEEVGKNTYVKQPVPRAYKCGGGVTGEKAKHHSGRKARSAGGAPGQPDVATNQPEVPNNRFSFSNAPNGVKSMTGIKRGGKVEHSDAAEDKKLIDKLVKPEARRDGEERKARAHGGETTKKVKGKTNINIIISAGGKDKDQQPQSNPMGGPVKPPSPPSPPPMSGSPPPMGPMPPQMGGMPPGGMPPGGIPPGPMPGGGLPPGHPGLPPGMMGR
jgi:hypothetical protein